MKNKNKKERRFLIGAVFKLLSHCSLACVFALARFLSIIIAVSKNQVSNNTQQNITLCFAHKSAKEQKQLFRKSIHHTVCSLLEMAVIWHQPIERVLALVKKKDICANYKTDTGAKIIIVPHFGSWELMNLWLAEQGSLYALYKPAKSSQLDHYILSKRTRNGALLVATNLKGLRELLKGLKAGAMVMILPDQKPSKDSAKVDSKFYGHDASTSLLIKNLISKVSCSVYMASAMRDLSNPSFDIKLTQLDADKMSADDQQSADYLNQSIEQFIAVDESQYQWSYQRFSQKTYSQTQP